MPATLTPRLGLTKPDPNPLTGDFVDVTVLNADFDKLDAAVGCTICTAGTRPGAPFDGQLIRETDTRRVLVWNATQAVWDPVNGPFLCASGSRPASPFTNMMIRETDTRRVYIWNATQAVWDLVADPAARLPLSVRRTSDSATNLTTVAVADTQLRFTISTAQIGRYMVTGQLWYNSSTLADFKCHFTHSAAFGMRWAAVNASSTADISKPDFGLAFDSAVKNLGGTGTFAPLGIAGMVNFTAAGTFIFNWGQIAADAAGNTFVLVESWLKLDPIS